MNAALSSRTQKKIAQLGVVAAYIFGSQATGKAGPLSDFDVGVLFSNRPSRGSANKLMRPKDYFDAKLKLIGIFKEEFKTDRVDVVVLNNAPSLLAMNVIKDGRTIFCADKQLLVAFEARTICTYCDYLPFERMYANALKQRLTQRLP